jgi:hypothetical protein
MPDCLDEAIHIHATRGMDIIRLLVCYQIRMRYFTSLFPFEVTGDKRAGIELDKRVVQIN